MIKVREKFAKTILSKSKVYDYTVNPYTGCEHSCTYCYARFMKITSKEEWGSFVEVKCNVPQLLQKEIRRKRKGKVWISGVCDPYQPVEKKYRLTRKCLEILLRNRWKVVVQTKSPLVLRDIDLLEKFRNNEVGFTITTADEGIRQIFEPKAPPIRERIDALTKLHDSGIKTFVMIAPILPQAENLVNLISDRADYVLIDRMNYHYADWVYRKYDIEYAKKDEFFSQMKDKLVKGFEESGILCEVLF